MMIKCYCHLQESKTKNEYSPCFFSLIITLKIGNINIIIFVHYIRIVNNKITKLIIMEEKIWHAGIIIIIMIVHSVSSQCLFFIIVVVVFCKWKFISFFSYSLCVYVFSSISFPPDIHQSASQTKIWHVHR